MKKIIALILLITIPIGLIISGSSKKPLLDRVEKDGYSLQPKDSLWEYVKHEVGEGRINLKTNYAEKYKDPILVTVENATAKDSIAIEGLIKELKRIFPLKEVAYFSDFVGRKYEPLDKNNANDNFRGYSYDELVSFNTQLIFYTDEIKINGSNHSSSNLEDRNIYIEYSRKNKWNRYFSSVNLKFNIKDSIPIEDRAFFIKFNFFRSMWKINSTELGRIRPDFRREQVFHSSYWRGNLTKISGAHYLKDDRFLLEKLFSKNFKEQYENYMYKTYPWRYANLFINKDEAKQNATAIVGFMGLLILILGCSLFWNRKFEGSFSSYFWAVLVYLIGFSGLNSLYVYLVHIDSPTNAIRGILGSLVFAGLLALVISFLFWQLEKRMISKKAQFGYQLIFKLGLTFLFFYLPYGLTMIFYNSIELSGAEVTRSLTDLQFLFIVIGLTLGRGLLLYLNHYSESLVKQKDVELSQLKEVNAQAEVKRLQAQINPHFLYNALNSIAGLAHENADKTERMALSLSDLFRYSINRKDENKTSVKEELTMVRNYLEIEQIRFGDRLQFKIDVSDEVENESIPRFILQPLIENAVKHGISKIEEIGKIALKLEKEEKELIITVSDNGPDFPEGLVCGHGLQTVFDLLRLSYGDKASINWNNHPQKNIEVKLPLKS